MEPEGECGSSEAGGCACLVASRWSMAAPLATLNRGDREGGREGGRERGSGEVTKSR